MMGTMPAHLQEPLFCYRANLERRVRPDHPLRQINAILDLGFVLPAVNDCYGRSGHVSLDPRVIVKLMLLLFYYNIPSERELMEQLPVRLDFLWFLGFDLETDIPDHSVLSKARARWGGEIFKQLFERSVQQCIRAGLVDGRLLHVDSTIVEANASKNSVIQSSPELVAALRQAYQDQEQKLQSFQAVSAASPPSVGQIPILQAGPPSDAPAKPEPSAKQTTAVEPQSQKLSAQSALTVAGPADLTADHARQSSQRQAQSQSLTAGLPVDAPAASAAREPSATVESVAPQKGPQEPSQKTERSVNQTHVSLTDPQAHLARCKNGATDLTFKEHRAVDDAHGVITAVEATCSTVADGTQLPVLVAQHQSRATASPASLAVAGDKHYGTAENFIYCADHDLRPHLGCASANVQERGQMPASRFVYDAKADHYVCPQGHFLRLHQQKPEEETKIYLIENAALCQACPLRAQCTSAKAGRSLKRHMQAEIIARGQAQANSPAGRYSRKRRKHVMEGSFADAANNHGSKRARWRGLARQQIQSWLICAVQNLRLLLKHGQRSPKRIAAIGGLLRMAARNRRNQGRHLARPWPICVNVIEL